MAYKIKDIYPSQVDTNDVGFPDGKPRNIQGGIQGTGTPFEEKLFQDYEGARQALFAEAGIDPSGVVDRVGQSDFVDGLEIKTLITILEQWGYNYKGRFSKGFTYSQEKDVGIDADGNSWIYVGAGAPNKVVTAGTAPSVGAGYEKVTFNAASGVVFNDGSSVQDFKNSSTITRNSQYKGSIYPTDGGETHAGDIVPEGTSEIVISGGVFLDPTQVWLIAKDKSFSFARGEITSLNLSVKPYDCTIGGKDYFICNSLQKEINAYTFWAAGDGIVDDSESLIAMASLGLLALKDGDYRLSKTVQMTGLRGQVLATRGARIMWYGGVSDTPLMLGDGSSVTQEFDVNQLYIRDMSALGAVNGMLKLNKCARSNFRNVSLVVSPASTTSIGLVINNSYLNNFYNLFTFGPSVGIRFEANSVANYFYGFTGETNGKASVWVPANTGAVVGNKFYGGTSENNIHSEIHGSEGTSYGILVEWPTTGLEFIGFYFERNDRHMLVKHTAAGNFPITMEYCRFFNAINGSSVLVEAPTTLNIKNSIYDSKDMVNVNYAGARYHGEGNRTDDTSLDEVVVLGGGVYVKEGISGDGYKTIVATGGLKVNGITALTGGKGRSVVEGNSSLTISFTQALSSPPSVFTQIVGGGQRDYPIRVSAPTVSSATLFNDNSTTTTVDWLYVV